MAQPLQLPSTCNGANPICHLTVEAIGPAWGGLIGNLGGHLAHIIVILVVAVVATTLARSAIRRVVKRIVRTPKARARAAVRHPAGNGGRTLPSEGTGAVSEAGVTENRVLPDPLRRAQRANAIGQLLSSAVTVAVWTIATLDILAELGINLAPLLAGAGIAGVAIGFGAQNLVRDVISGIFMLLEDQYGVGDIIDVGTASGTVEQVRLRSTQLRDLSGVVWHIPNGEIKRVGNKSQQWSRAVIDVRVSYDTNLQEALVLLRAVAMEVYRDDPVNIMEEPEVQGVEDFGPNGAILRTLVKTLPAQQWAVQRAMRAKIKTAFDEAGIEIPWLYTPRPVTSAVASDPGVPVALGHASDESKDQPKGAHN